MLYASIVLTVATLLVLIVVSTLLSRAARVRSRELGRTRAELETLRRQQADDRHRFNNSLQAEAARRQDAEESLRRLSDSVLQIQDEERRRIARDLHDGAAQILGAAGMNVDRARSLAQTGDFTSLDVLLSETGELVVRAATEIRTLSYLIHPPMLDDLGLDYVLPAYTEGFSSRTGISVNLSIDPDLGRLAHDAELTLYRIAQEALTNIHRHSGSRTASVSLFQEDGSVTLEIRDEGCGFAPGSLDTVSGRLGVGISAMRERAQQLGGRLDIVGRPDGSIVRAVLPLASSPSQSAS